MKSASRRRDRARTFSIMAGNNNNRKGPSSKTSVLYLVVSFLAGCAVCCFFFLHIQANTLLHDSDGNKRDVFTTASRNYNILPKDTVSISEKSISSGLSSNNKINTDGSTATTSTTNLLAGKSILVALAAFDFSQIPHLEEVLDSYRDVCEAGAKVDLFVHTTVPFPVAFIDLLNTRLRCTSVENFTVTISINSPKLRLHLVDLHRTLFYDRLEDYDLFVFSEDDIRVRPTTLAAYLEETNKVKELLKNSDTFTPSDYNVGIVRYEYNFPPDVIINDKTRHVTKDVTRVYWEHVAKPIVPKAVTSIHNSNSKSPEIAQHYVTMGNHHQGMFMATQDLLRAWKMRSPTCRFDVVRDRPGVPQRQSQPAEGTQRVWMSSQMLYGGKHCNVLQLLPVHNFGALTVFHTSNKNYRRVGKQGRVGGNKEGATKNEFGDGTEKFDLPDPSLLTAMQLHLAIVKEYGHENDYRERQQPYQGIRMVNDIISGGFYKGQPEHRALVDKTMKQFHAYTARGGYLVESDYAEYS